jgi:hypothetical protein
MKNINIFLKIAIGACLACGAASATTTIADFNLTTGQTCGGTPSCTDSGTQTGLGGNMQFSSYTQVNGGTATGDTATVTAWVTSSPNTTSGLNAAYVGEYGSGYGLGICTTSTTGSANETESGTGCTSPYHQVNNSDNYEFLLITFTTAVNISDIQLANFGGSTGSTVDMSNTYYTGGTGLATDVKAGDTLTQVNSSYTANNVNCGSASCTGATYSSGNATPTTNAPTGGWVSETSSGPDGSLVEALSNANGVYSLLIGAEVGQSDDFFKVQAIEATIATPEPASFGMIGLALLGLGLAGRRKFQSSKS